MAMGQKSGVMRSRLLLSGGGEFRPTLWWSGAGLRPWMQRELLRRREWLCLPVGLLLAVLGKSVLPLLAGAAAVPLVKRWLTARERAGQRDLRAEAVITFCGSFVGELRAGLQPAQALLTAARSTGASVRQKLRCWQPPGSAAMCRAS